MCTIYCIGRNYVKHAQELGHEVPSSPVVFLKSWASLRGVHDSDLAWSQEVFHHEVELVLKIARDLKRGDKVRAEDISEIGLGLDLTRREVQNELKAQGLPWTLAKSFAGSAVLGKMRPFEDRPYRFELKVQGLSRQIGDSTKMIFPFLSLCNFINSFSPLRKGDLIFTGTPEGVGPIRKGDDFEFYLDGELSDQGTL
jgi:2-keto-4-pentenoate hydratase/2-oxohepta-3-ene-1,7-dioic acid hydratase in catechol pathway